MLADGLPEHLSLIVAEVYAVDMFTRVLTLQIGVAAAPVERTGNGFGGGPTAAVFLLYHMRASLGAALFGFCCKLV